MKLSVIIPCYNFENYIEQGILSALAQRTNFEFEVLVRDDKSTDNSYKHIERYSEFVRLLDSSENLGAARNIKTLIDNCRGEYIAYLDGDDYWADIYKLQKQVDYMDANPDCIMTFTGHWTKGEEVEGGYIPPEPYLWLCIPSIYENDEVKTHHLLDRNPATFGRVFRNINGLIKDWMLDIVYFDWVTNYELSKLGRIQYLNIGAGIYRVHKNGVFSLSDEETKNRLTFETSEIIKKDYERFIN